VGHTGPVFDVIFPPGDGGHVLYLILAR